MNDHSPMIPDPVRPGVGISELVSGQLVLVALAGSRVTPECLRDHGARDVLMLEEDGNLPATREPCHVSQRYRRLADVRCNNCSVAILHDRAAFALTEKRKFARFKVILVPIGLSQVAVALGLARYGRRGVLMPAGTTEIECNGVCTRYRVLKADVRLRDQRRQFGPAGISPLEMMRRLSGIDHVVLRWSEMMEAGTHEGDIDILVSQAGLRDLKERFGTEVCTYPLDVYTDDGQGGHGYKSVPYFTPGLAKGVLESAAESAGGIRTASPWWRFLAFCYHLMFHNKSEHVRPGAVDVGPDTFHKPHYHQELKRLADLAGREVPRTFDDIERLLHDAGVMPSLDLVGFYSNRNAFLKRRYFEQAKATVGLATFFVRDFGGGPGVVATLRERLKRHFEILIEGPVDQTNRERVIMGVRGGNWSDHDAPGGRAEPVYWFVCWDPSPRKPSARTRRKHPRVDNEHIRIKDELRRDLGSGEPRGLRVVHSSDNSLEALDHLGHLGLRDHPLVISRI